jgi:hypothetical protein
MMNFRPYYTPVGHVITSTQVMEYIKRLAGSSYSAQDKPAPFPEGWNPQHLVGVSAYHPSWVTCMAIGKTNCCGSINAYLLHAKMIAPYLAALFGATGCSIIHACFNEKVEVIDYYEAFRPRVLAHELAFKKLNEWLHPWAELVPEKLSDNNWLLVMKIKDQTLYKKYMMDELHHQSPIMGATL